MKDIIILLGPPASGKGTQAKLLSTQSGYFHLSSGYLLRKEIETGSELGKEIAALINYGNLVSDELVFKALKKKLKTEKFNGLILDGFPRTLKQAEMLFEYIKDTEFLLKKVFVIDLDKDNILQRIGFRINCKNCGAIYNAISKKPKIDGVCDICQSNNLTNRHDDLDIEAIYKRIDIFKINISKIISFYEKKSLIFLIDGLKDVDTINLEIVKALNSN